MKRITIFFITFHALILHFALAQDTIRYYYQDGTLKSKGKVDQHGLKIGTWFFYYSNGVLNAQEHYSQNQLEGKVYNYYPDGKLKSVEVWQDDYQTDSAFYYHQDGGLDKYGIYKTGLYHGIWHFYYESGV
ncbi:MAG: toxin-antitoxin system YwqK family antitoxin, partial [Cyclobacteriaceae bacterium]